MSFRAVQEELRVATRGQGFVDVTSDVERVVVASGVRTGTATVTVLHTSASLVVQENADPSVRRDLARFLDGLAPEGPNWEHDDEGPDDMPAHAKAAVTKTSEVLPVTSGALRRGTWQALYLWEHRRAPHTRTLVVTVMGEAAGEAGGRG